LHMWFKNLSIFRLTEDFTLAPADLAKFAIMHSHFIYKGSVAHVV